MSKYYLEPPLIRNLRQFIAEMKTTMNTIIEGLCPLQYKEQIVILTSMTKAIQTKNPKNLWQENSTLPSESKKLLLARYQSFIEAYNHYFTDFKIHYSRDKFGPGDYHEQGREKLQEYLDDQITHLEKQQELIEKLAKIADADVKLYDQTVQNFLDQEFESNKKEEFSQQIQKTYETQTQNIRDATVLQQRPPVEDYINKELPLRQEQWQQQRKKEYKFAVGLYNINLQLEKTVDKEQSDKLLQEKQQLITQYKETLTQTIEHKASEVTEYRLVKDGLLTTEEAEAINNHQLLNRWDAIKPTDDQYRKLKNFLKVIADYYPGEKLQGFKELSTMHFDKAFVVLDAPIDTSKIGSHISLADLTYIETEEEARKVFSLFSFRDSLEPFEDRLFQVGAVETFIKLINDPNRPKIKPPETLEFMGAVLTNNNPEIEKYLITGVKLDSSTSSLLLKRVKNKSDMIDLKRFISILDLTANTMGKSILHLAAQYGDLETLKILKDKGIDIDSSIYRAATLLHLALQNKHPEVAKALIEWGADVNAKDSDATPMHLAVQYRYLEILQMLKDRGAKFNDGTSLRRAVQYGHLDVVKLLIEWGVDGNSKSIFTDTPLHQAAQGGNLEVVKVLIAAGADVNAKGHSFKDRGTEVKTEGELRCENTPLHVATKYGHVDILKELIKHHANVKTRNMDGYTALHLATQNGNLNSVKELIRGGSDINAKGKGDSTPMHLAVQYGYLEVVKELIKCGGNINNVDSKGSYALPLKIIQKNSTMLFQANMTHIRQNTPPEEIAPTLIKLISELNKRTDANGMRSFIKRFEAELPKEIANQVPLSKEHINENSSRSNSPTPSATMPKPSGRNL